MLDTVVGFTQASSVIAEPRCRVAESGTLTVAFDPLKDSPLPYFPAAVHAAFASVPVLPLPEASATVVPEPSLNAYAATRPPAVACAVVAVATFEYAPRLAAASVARTR